MKTTKKLMALATAFIFAFAFAAIKPVNVQAATDLTLSVSGDKVMLGTTEIGNNDGTAELFLDNYASGDVNLIVEDDVNLDYLDYVDGNLVIKGNGTLKVITKTIMQNYAIYVSKNLTISGSVNIEARGGINANNLIISGTPNVEAYGLTTGIKVDNSIAINITGGEVNCYAIDNRVPRDVISGQTINLGDGVREKFGEEIVTLSGGKQGIKAFGATFIYDASNQGGGTGGNTGGNTNPANESGATTNDTPADPKNADPNKAPKTGESHAFVLSMLGIIAVAGMGLYVGKKQEN